MPANAVAETQLHRGRAPGLRLDWMLIAICVLAALPRLYFAATQFLEYDGFWHVFIAEQDNWQIFWQEYMNNDHPLLFYLLLKVLVHLGRSPLLYRAIPMASGVGSVYLVGKIAGKLCASQLAPPLTALAFGLAMPGIEISISVRSYMLCVFFVLLSFYYFLDLLPGAGLEPPRHSRIGFALSIVLAVSSHYFSFFYVPACGLLWVGYAIARRSFQWKTWRACGLMFLPVLAVMAIFYFTHIRHNATNMAHLPQFLYTGGESRFHFFIRNLQSLYNYFSPWPMDNLLRFERVAAALAAAAIGITVFVRGRARIGMQISLILLVELVTAGLLGRYPFGGYLRQQFILFPFLLVTAGICVDRLLTLVRLRYAAGAAIVLALGVGTVSWNRIHAIPRMSQELFTREMNLFDTAVPDANALFIDQYNLIAFFGHHHQWQWHYERQLPMATRVDEYSLRLGSRSMLLLRDRTRWNFEFLDAGFMHDVAETLHAARLNSVAVFCVHQVPGARTPREQQDFRQKVVALAEMNQLQVPRFEEDGLNVYAEFAPAGRAAAARRETARR